MLLEINQLREWLESMYGKDVPLTVTGSTNTDLFRVGVAFKEVESIVELGPDKVPCLVRLKGDRIYVLKTVEKLKSIALAERN